MKALTHHLNGRISKIDLYEVNKYATLLECQERELNKDMNMLEIILSTRMTTRETNDTMKFLRALLPSANVREIEDGLVSFANNFLQKAEADFVLSFPELHLRSNAATVMQINQFLSLRIRIGHESNLCEISLMNELEENKNCTIEC